MTFIYTRKIERENSTTKVASFRTNMNYENKDLIYKIKENTIKKT